MYSLNSYDINAYFDDIQLQQNTITFRELVIISLGIANRPISLQLGYSHVKLIVKRFTNLYPFYLPSKKTYSKMVTKLIHQKIVNQSLVNNNRYYYSLSDIGMGHFDLIWLNLQSSKHFNQQSAEV